MSKQFWAVIAAIVVIFLGIFALGGKKSDNGNSSNSNKTLTNHVIGNASSGVKLVEYGDYQCPYCEAYAPTVQQIQEEYKDKVQFQFRNYPLTQAHPNAFAAARAAEAAGLQNKFWEMHEALYSGANYSAWTTAKDPYTLFEGYAKQLGLNTTQFKSDFASNKVNDLINGDMEEGNRIGITGTPSFFINGKAVQIANSPEAFRKVLDQAIAQQAKAKSSAKPSSTPAADNTAAASTTAEQPAAQ